MLTEHFFTDRNSLTTTLVKECSAILAEAIEQHRRASFLVSGGSSPELLYQRLSETDLDWASVDVALVDERWVDADHSGSNTAFIHRTLLQNDAVKARFVVMKTTKKTAREGLDQCEKNYQALYRPFDLTILGMGADGHTASLFPSADGLGQALDIHQKRICAAIKAHRSAVTGALTERVSLTLHGLLQSKQLHLLITGEEKLAVYKKALIATDHTQTPISALLQQTTVPIGVYWAP